MSESLNQILKPQLQIELQNVSPPGILTTSAGYCFIEFDSHQLASSCFPLISISAIQSTEARRRDAERHTLICAYNKYRYHSKMLIRVRLSLSLSSS